MKDFNKLKNQIVLTVTPEGLRIELLETQSGTFFDLGSPELNGNGQKLLALLAQELGKVPNKITIEGHTDAKPYTGRKELQQLGAFHRSRQFGAPPDAGQSSCAKTRFHRCAATPIKNCAILKILWILQTAEFPSSSTTLTNRWTRRCRRPDKKFHNCRL